MKQNKTGTVYFTCDRTCLTKTADVLKYGDYNMLITMYGDDLPYIYIVNLCLHLPMKHLGNLRIRMCLKVNI